MDNVSNFLLLALKSLVFYLHLHLPASASFLAFLFVIGMFVQELKFHGVSSKFASAIWLSQNLIQRINHVFPPYKVTPASIQFSDPAEYFSSLVNSSKMFRFTMCKKSNAPFPAKRRGRWPGSSGAAAAFTLVVYGHVTRQVRRDGAARMEPFIKSVSRK